MRLNYLLLNKKQLVHIYILSICCWSCGMGIDEGVDAEKVISPQAPLTVKEKYDTLFEAKLTYKNDGFDYPVGKPNAKGYYNAQGFGGKSGHLGDDWNARTGGNSDLGDPIYAVANGYVRAASDRAGGWGRVIQIVHQLDSFYVESLYAHCLTMEVTAGDWVKRGDRIASIGNNKGMYYAHLHLEIRNQLEAPLGAGYSSIIRGYLDPTLFINAHRPQ